MRYLSALAFVLLLNSSVSFGQERDLRLTINIVSQQACALNADLDALQLTLQLRYANVGNRKLILYKGNRLFYQVYISRSAEAAAARKFELRTTHARYFDEQPEKIWQANPGDVFTALSPGTSYQTRQVISLPVARGAVKQSSDTISGGEHVLFLIASTWFESKKLAEELRGRWRDRGLLWTDTLSSNAVNFSVARERATLTCQRNLPRE